ncbi:MAG: Omp28-related outer membrane protein [Bacteroidetes bacterium]|nr:Omp28-related outer membrane protein [Bacteroidota bacterium]
MKPIVYSFIAASAFAFLGCDYVNKPTSVTPGGGTTPTPNVVTRKVLVEDYTGHECGNCPAAAIKGQDLENLYHDQVVLLAVHAGYFADPAAAPFTDDFRCTAGTDWDTFFGISQGAGNPNGMINRKDYPAGTHIKNHNNWAAETSPFINQAADVKLSITPNYNTSAKTLDVSVKSKFIHALSANYKLSVVLAEDSIVGAQKDYSQNPSVITNYLFMHVLRGGINGSWGDPVNTAAVAANDSITKSYTGFAINPLYNENRLHVIAFLYNAATYEVIQVEEVKMK